MKSHEPANRSITKSRRFGFVVIVAIGALLVTRALMDMGTIRGPYPAPGKFLAWLLGAPAPAYNSAMVERGRVYRSARPDARFLEWMRRTHGIRRVIGLSGSDPVHEIARQLGMEVTTFTWESSRLPPREELDAVVELLAGGEPVLVHCASGSDRTGYVIAAYRVERMNWAVEDAVTEMRAYWHDPERHPDLHRALRARFERSTNEKHRSALYSEAFVAGDAQPEPRSSGKGLLEKEVAEKLRITMRTRS